MSNRCFAFSLLAVLLISSVSSVYANSLEVDGPGFKMQNRTGWFGTRSTTYTDALGNKVNRSKGLFRTTTRTSVFGTQTYKHGQNVSVTAPNGTPLISTKRTWFGGRNTKVDGNNILHSFSGLFGNSSTSGTTASP